jgi:two-component system response regulator DevR
MALRVLVVDDSEVARAGLEAALESHRFEVVGSTSSASEAELLASQHQPDVAILDVRMPNCSGFEVAKRISRVSPKTRFLFVTAHEADIGTEEISAASSWGLLLKTASLSELCKAVEQVAEGGSVLDPAIAKTLVHKIGGRRLPDPLSDLTRRERAVYDMLARGCSDAEIAEALSISPRTAKNYVARILQKLGLSRRSQVPAYAASAALDDLSVK